jgi:DNA-binding transcriptional LysR family regulator
MQFESLKVFCDVARFRSFSQAAAAQRPPITQSAASQVVLQLEKRLGVQLVNRATRPLHLTALGQMYYEGCKGLIEQYDELEARLKNAQADLASSIQVAAIYSVGLGDMEQYVERFHELLPNVKVQIEYLHPDRVLEKVRDGTADLGLVSFPRKSRDLAALPWREEEMVLVCPPGHILARLERVHPLQLHGEKYIGFAKGLVIRRHLDRFLHDQDVSVEVVMEFDSIENIKKAIEIGAGIALLPEPTLRREVQAGTLAARPLVGDGLVRPLGIIHRRHYRLSSSASRFVELLQETEDLAPVDARRDGPHRSRNGTAHAPKKDRVS